MPVSIVVGGQYGSEGKGKVVALLGSKVTSPWLVRCGGPNSGHTVTIGGKDTILRQVPCSVNPSDAFYCLAAGCVIDEALLLYELDLLGIDRDRIIVDSRAVILTEADRREESRSLQSIGSTCSGTGAAQVRRMSRRSDVRLAGDSEAIRSRCRIVTVAPVLHNAINAGRNIIVEGTQGFGLSLLHGPHYPYVTSRDTTASGFAMEVGLSPRVVDEIILVVRTFPIRVGGSSGPFPEELSWDEVAQLSGAPKSYPEYTSVTNRLRRVARFNFEAVRVACQYNRPTAIAIMGLDRIDFRNFNSTDPAELTQSAKEFVAQVERSTGVPVEIVGTGFGTLDAVMLGVRSIAAEITYA
jgi:adenylosuccinate synthase